MQREEYHHALRVIGPVFLAQSMVVGQYAYEDAMARVRRAGPRIRPLSGIFRATMALGAERSSAALIKHRSIRSDSPDFARTASMTRASIDVGVMSRIERTTRRARDTVQNSFTRLQDCLCSSYNDYPDDAQLERRQVLHAAAEAVGDLTRRVLEDLRIMCEIAVTNGALTSPAHLALAATLSDMPTAMGRRGPVIDLRQQRMMRLPLNEALQILLGNLDEMCNEIEDLIAVMTFKPVAAVAGRGAR
jgi:hypothetical protein